MSYELNPFDQIIDLEYEQNSLYKDLMTKNDEENIANVWFKYSTKALQNLITIANFAKIIYLRYYDEFTKDKENVLDNKQLASKISEKIRNVLKIVMESSLLLQTYYRFLSDGIFDEQCENLDFKSLLVSEKHIDFIFSLFFETENVDGCLTEISPIMAILREKNQKQRLLTLLNESKIDDDQYNDTMGSVFETNGKYFTLNIAPLIKQISKEWWWEDEILLYFIYNLGMQNYKDSIKYWQESKHQEIKSKAKRIKLINLPLAKTESIYALANHHYNVAINNANTGLHKHATKYFEKVISLCNDALEIIGDYPSGEYLRTLQKKIFLSKQHATLLFGISKLNVLFRSMSKLIEEQKFQQASQLTSDIQKLSQSLIGLVDLKYLSGIPLVFETIASTSELMISLEKDKQEIIDKTLEILQSFKIRIITATNQIVNNWNDLATEKDHVVLQSKLNNDLTDIKSLMESISMLPSTVFDRNIIHKRLECLKNLTLSVLEDIKSSEKGENNKIQELIHKAKSHFFIQIAFKLSNEISDQQLPIERIHAHHSGTFISGKSVQMNLYQLACEYLCLSEVLPSLFLAVSQDPNVIENKKESINIIRNSLESNTEFIKMLKHIKNDCDTLLKYKKDFSKILVKVDWVQIKVRKSLLTGILVFYESIAEAIVASWASQLELYDDALVNFKLAQDKAFEAADILKKFNHSTLKKENAASHVFSFAQFCQTGYNDVLEEKSVKLPAQQLFKLFRDMIFSI